MSTYTVRNNLEKIDQNSLPFTWGIHEDATKDRLDEALDGTLSVVVNGTLTLVQATDTTDQVHFAGLNITGGVGGNLRFPSTQWLGSIYNGATGDVTVSVVSGGANCVVHPGQLATVMSDGTNFRFGWGGINPQDAVATALTQAKAYTDAAAFGSLSGSLPGQGGNAGKYLATNGTSPTWAAPAISDIAGLQTQLNKIQGIALYALSIAQSK